MKATHTVLNNLTLCTNLHANSSDMTILAINVISRHDIAGWENSERCEQELDCDRLNHRLADCK